MSDTLVAAAEEVRKKIRDLAEQIVIDAKMAELKKLLTGLNTLEDLCGQPRTQMGSFFDFGQLESSNGLTIRPDEFYGLEPLAAAKRYLRKLGKSATLRDIVAALKSGGCDPGNEDRFALSLARSTMEIVKIGDDLFGVVEFYPHVKRERGPRRKKGSASPESASTTVGDETVSPESGEENAGASVEATASDAEPW